ncbi:Receptor-like serine/threonine-protein kinase SD1-8 [Abeliophyllum distichum]|uniref:Receptor-like serine/threonine-protein kinase n=1 Tax=Abeliophyllum distichum TaxID=126358 RepID=A0ABD1Q889_9LAMI
MKTDTFIVFFGLSVWLSNAKDTISPKEILRQNDTLVSAGRVFELGFFPDGVFGNLFLGIWLKKDGNKKPVWIANRENPLEDSTSTLQIRHDGNLILTDLCHAAIIVNYGMISTGANTSATLLDTGNFVLRQRDEVIWQSFDYPTDTYLPGMKIGWFGMLSDQPRFQALVSWLSPRNPTRGCFTLGTGYKDARKLSVWRGQSVHMDIGSLEGRVFRFIFKNSFNSFNFSYFSTQNETYLTFNTIGEYEISWLVMASMGRIDEYTLSKGNISSSSHRICDESKTVNSSVCLEEETQICDNGDKFTTINGSMPTSMIVNSSIIVNFDDCKFTCQGNCSCTGFALLQDDQWTCQLYFGDKSGLLDNIRRGGGVVYVRETASFQQKRTKKWRLRLILMSSTSLSIVALLILLCYIKHTCRVTPISEHGESRGNGEVTLLEQSTKNAASIEMQREIILELNREDQQLSWFNFNVVENATEHFNTEKLGEGGFGPVFKGQLPNGQEIAVKRLSKKSVQGVKEFKNEVTLISKLQHRNLVRLLGCCIQGEEYLLIYEYMLNRSLDSFIFDSSKQVLLDFKRRGNIIEGIAQGLLYLHKYSRLRIIHRDLKTSNILLDGDMNPKISDFGMARTFGEDETRAKTTKIAGTYGYMSPEYAMDGNFSEKSDVFSFGIIVLEIISGKRNIAFFETDHSLNLLGYAWKLWKEGRSMEFMDSTMADSCTVKEAEKYVQLGLLFVQDRAADRPTMSDVVTMLRNDVSSLPHPKEPAFFS